MGLGRDPWVPEATGAASSSSSVERATVADTVAANISAANAVVAKRGMVGALSVSRAWDGRGLEGAVVLWMDGGTREEKSLFQSFGFCGEMNVGALVEVRDIMRIGFAPVRQYILGMSFRRAKGFTFFPLVWSSCQLHARAFSSPWSIHSPSFGKMGQATAVLTKDTG